MKKIGVAAFTKGGRALALRLKERLEPEYEVLEYADSLKDWCRECFQSAAGIIFIGACGIAVRTVAPFLKSKTEDPAVLVIDEMGNYVISLLSGHIGGANEFAVEVAKWIGAVPVITTASDVNGKIAVDVFAVRNHLEIASMTAAKKIAAAILCGEPVGVYCSGRVEGKLPPELTPAARSGNESDVDMAIAASEKYLVGDANGSAEHLERNAGVACKESEECGSSVKHLLWISERPPESEKMGKYLRDGQGTVLHLIPRVITIGIGCRRGKTEEEIEAVTEKVIRQAGISPRAILSAASIDLKKEEAGLLKWAGRHGLDIHFYPAEELSAVSGTFQASEFVKKTTGVDNVCERAALLEAERKYREVQNMEKRETAAACVKQAEEAPRWDRGSQGAEALLADFVNQGVSKEDKNIPQRIGEKQRIRTRLLAGKYAENGVTVALAVQDWSVRFGK